MPKQSVTDIVQALAEPIVQASGVDLVEVEYTKEGATWYLRVFIDKPGGVDIDDCSRVSEALSERLDEVDPIPNAYILEVSSPGAERPLKKPEDYERAVGRAVRVKLYEPLAGEKVIEGVLDDFDGQTLTITRQAGGAERRVLVPFSKVAAARLSLEW
ncbi:ribosome maturation factor RimP [Alicyclobacillus kakegawensis]|uniref:ribosome maturation factor RimP n=1 Tax=Alicyclobacillus kakegawensis TaxID=392012 RepID=UPI0008302AD2|nr:ribosome maturation factor RimP [Alicyclobacillus kakegawensis]